MKKVLFIFNCFPNNDFDDMVFHLYYEHIQLIKRLQFVCRYTKRPVLEAYTNLISDTAKQKVALYFFFFFVAVELSN